MSWNYQVGYRKKSNSLSIYSAYYKEDGEIECTSLEPEAAEGESLDDLKMVLQLILEATDKPILEIPDDID
jgi:hypothetical protein